MDNTPLLKVMIADDSAVVRGMLRKIIEAENGFVVSNSAANGQMAVRDYIKYQPDVVIMDINMPEMNGLEAMTGILKQDKSAKILICSSLTQAGAAMTVKALKMGAVDCLAKPSSNSLNNSEEFSKQLIMRLKPYAKKVTPPNSPLKTSANKTTTPNTTPPYPSKLPLSFKYRRYPDSMTLSLPRVIAIGSSTGGPKALSYALARLSKMRDLPPIFITQHMPEGFTKLLADNIQYESGIKTYEAEDDMLVKENTIYVAPGGKHLKIEKRTSGIFTVLDDGPQVNYCKPAVDVMFDSILKTYESNILSVILTGMGKDGRDSCQKIMDHSPKNMLIAQDQASCVVWGMPRAVATAGLCNGVYSLKDIPNVMNKILLGQRP